MSQVRVLDFEELPFRSHEEMDALTPAEREGTTSRQIFDGVDGGLQLFEVEIAPNVRVDSHAHLADEIIVVTRGSIVLGSRKCEVGAAVLIPARTLYGFSGGPQGGRFLNFRATADNSYLTSPELLKLRRKARLDVIESGAALGGHAPDSRL